MTKSVPDLKQSGTAAVLVQRQRHKFSSWLGKVAHRKRVHAALETLTRARPRVSRRQDG